jgi:hypothetical protein
LQKLDVFVELTDLLFEFVELAVKRDDMLLD